MPIGNISYEDRCSIPKASSHKRKKLWSRFECFAYLKKKIYTKTCIWFINLGPIRLISIKFEISLSLYNIFYIYVSRLSKIQWICQRKKFMTIKWFEFYTKVISHWRHPSICLEFYVPFPQSTIIRETSQKKLVWRVENSSHTNQFDLKSLNLWLE